MGLVGLGFVGLRWSVARGGVCNVGEFRAWNSEALWAIEAYIGVLLFAVDMLCSELFRFPITARRWAVAVVIFLMLVSLSSAFVFVNGRNVDRLDLFSLEEAAVSCIMALKRTERAKVDQSIASIAPPRIVVPPSTLP